VNRNGLPIVATVLVGLAHSLAWRSFLGLNPWIWIALGYAPLFAISISILRKDEVLGELFKPVAGDLSRGIIAAAGSLAFLYGVARVGLRLSPEVVARDLTGVIRVAASVSATTRGLGIFVFAVVEEIVWRGAVVHVLEEKHGTGRAAWIASALFVVAVVPSLHPGLMVAGVALGISTALVVSRFRRLSIAVVVHAFFTWIAVEMMLPHFWEKIRAM
jgi:membrane protease YdiL (CAAX protease family)